MTFNLLGFKVLLCEDQTGSEMKKTLECISTLNLHELQQINVQEWSDEKHEFTDLNVEEPLQHNHALVCYIHSHTDKGGVKGTGGQILSIEDITTPFNVENCPVLKNKPKVFLLELGLKDEDLPEEHSMEEDFLIAIGNKEERRSHGDVNGHFFTQSVVRQLQDGMFR